jgi:Fe-S-cluster containining protein
VETKFNCTKCGACCRLVPDVVLNFYKLPRAEGGGCGHLLSDNSCNIYNDRPDICNVHTMYNKFHHENLSWEEYIAISEESCKILLEIDSLKSEKKQ